MNLRRLGLYAVLAASPFYLSGCQTKTAIIDRNQEPEHTIGYYHKPSDERYEKGVLNNPDSSLLRELEENRITLEGELDKLFPFGKKEIGKPEGVKAKPGIYFIKEWEEVMRLLGLSSPQ